MVLRGEPKKLTGRLTSEVFMLAPWQNGGKFFRLKLEEKENLIIGPKALLEPYRNSATPLPVAYIEEMSDEELEFFKVPEKLRKTATETVIDPPVSSSKKPAEEPLLPNPPLPPITPTAPSPSATLSKQPPSRCYWVSILVGSVAMVCFIAMAVLLALYVPQFPHYASWIVGGAGTVLGGGLVAYGIYNRAR